ncbi:7417_t:CDS:1 [Ambispora gerdemannii]|uniref:7417_t:CDS:1 n=1 Tax=Ambispora gerdemannii TaxID=144530 RepID=A0A9N9GRG0_9GLOM|nr:7417_t:CDS:1 [Ambispora gerdemannii]
MRRNSGHSWRLRMYPRGYDERYKSYLSVYLEGFQTCEEKEKSLTRHKEFELEAFRSQSDPVNGPSIPTHLASLQRSSQSFNFNNVINCGQHQFCSLEEVFPNDRNVNTTLIIRVRIFDKPQSGSSSTNSDSNHPSSSVSSGIVLPAGFNDFLTDKLLADVEFVFDCGSRLKAHRIILAAQSSYFKALLLGRWRESKMDSIPIKDTDHNSFRSVLQFFYTGKLEQTSDVDLLTGVYILADKFDLKELVQMAASQIVKFVNDENWDEILLLGWRTNNHGMRRAGIEYAAGNWSKVKNSDNTKRVLSAQDVNIVEELMVCVFFHS